MARYDYEGTQQYAEQKFAEARQYNEEQAKKQEKFAKRLLAFDTVVKGANALINQRANELDAKQLPQKAAYQNLINRSQSFRTTEAERVKSGLSVEDYLENKYYTQLKTEAETDFSYLSPMQYSTALREEASRLAKANLTSYNNLIETTKNIPTFEDFTEYYEEQADIPRNLASWIGSKAKGFVRKETEETLKLKNERANDALYGTAMFNKFGELSTDLRAYDTVTNQGIDAAKIINRLNLTTGRLVPNMEQKETVTEIDKIKGVTTEKVIVSLATMTPDGNVEYRKENKHVIAEVTSRTGEDRVKLTELQNLYKLVKPEEQNNIQSILQSKDGGLPTYEQYEKAREYLTKNPDAYAIDWSDEKAKTDSFPDWYSIQIKYVKDPTTGKRIAQETEVGSGIYEIKEDFRKVAEELELDERNMLDKYNKLGIEAAPTMSSLDMDKKDKKDLITLIKDPVSKKAYEEALENTESDLYALLDQKKIAESKSDIVLLGTEDLEIAFPNLGLTGKRQLFWDRTNNKFLF
jgi:hypothetical protein